MRVVSGPVHDWILLSGPLLLSWIRRAGLLLSLIIGFGILSPSLAAELSGTFFLADFDYICPAFAEKTFTESSGGVTVFFGALPYLDSLHPSRSFFLLLLPQVPGGHSRPGTRKYMYTYIYLQENNRGGKNGPPIQV